MLGFTLGLLGFRVSSGEGILHRQKFFEQLDPGSFAWRGSSGPYSLDCMLGSQDMVASISGHVTSTLLTTGCHWSMANVADYD